MRSPPSPILTGKPRPYWEPAEVLGCPFGPLVCAVCPTNVPMRVITSLHPIEQKYALSLEPAQRQREWVGGRLCLATALAQMSSARTALLPSPSGAPIVPAGTGGSISHKGPL